MKSMRADFVRFSAPDVADLFDYEQFVSFSEKPKNGFSGFIISTDSVRELLSSLRRAKKGCLVGVLSNDFKVNKEAVMRKRVDLLLDSSYRRLDYATLKLASEKDVTVEFALSKFLNSSGFRRAKIFEETKDTISLVKKFDLPFVLTSGATNVFELRPRRQVYDFFSFMGLDGKKAEVYMQRLIRRYTDQNFIADGIEILKSE